MVAGVLKVWDSNNIKVLSCRRLFTFDRVRQVDLVKSGELVTNLEPDREGEYGILTSIS